MTISTPSARPGASPSLAPGVIAAASFACADVLSKVVLTDGGGVLTLLACRSVVGIACFAAWLHWLQMGGAPTRLTMRERCIALGLGLLFAATVFGLFEAIARMDVPTAILSYFVYPLVTGLVAALTGLERLDWRGAAAAIIAFLGLGLMIGAHPGEIALTGVAFSFGAAMSRAAMLLLTRALLAKADARLITWYSLISSTVLFVGIALATRTWQPPQSGAGWAALVALSITTTIALLAVFLSAARVGPFRTALVMNLEPLLATIASAMFLGETIAPLQAAGGAIMLAALVVFQLRR